MSMGMWRSADTTGKVAFVIILFFVGGLIGMMFFAEFAEAKARKICVGKGGVLIEMQCVQPVY